MQNNSDEENKSKTKSQDTADMGKRAEESQHDSEEKYRIILGNIHYGCFEVDLAGNFTFFDDSICRILEYSKEELMGMNYQHYTDKENAKIIFQAYNKVYKTGKPTEVFNWKVIKKDGFSIFVEESISLKKDSSGKITGFGGILRDTTERKKVEGRLWQDEKKHRSILKNMHEGYFEVDLAGNYTFFNDSLCRIHGYTREELLGMNNRHYTDKENARKVFQAYNRVYKTGEPLTEFDWQIIRKDGTKRYVDASSSLLKDYLTEKPIGFGGILRDVTDRKQAENALRESEERYRGLVENASDVVFRTNETGHFTFVNPAVVRIFGYEAKELIGKHYSTLIRPDMIEETIKFFGHQIEKGIQNTYLEYSIIRKDGQEVCLGQNTQLFSEDGHVIGFQAVARDITESKKKEAEIIFLSITDQLTGLYNRRGFLSLAEQNLKLAERNKIGIRLFFADLDGLKWINDTLGHEEGDKALIETAAVLKDTFRASDIMARLGGDEFAILTIGKNEDNFETINSRLQSLIDARNNQENRRYKLSISIGYSCNDTENPCSIDELMVFADKMMYERKQKKKDLVFAERKEPIDMEERRIKPRIDEENEVTITIISEENNLPKEKTIESYTKDVSVFGAKIQTNILLQIDSFIDLEFMSKSVQEQIKTLGKVKWVKVIVEDESYEAGVEFRGSYSDAIEKLGDYISWKLKANAAFVKEKHSPINFGDINIAETKKLSPIDSGDINTVGTKKLSPTKNKKWIKKAIILLCTIGAIILIAVLLKIFEPIP